MTLAATALVFSRSRLPTRAFAIAPYGLRACDAPRNEPKKRTPPSGGVLSKSAFALARLLAGLLCLLSLLSRLLAGLLTLLPGVPTGLLTLLVLLTRLVRLVALPALLRLALVFLTHVILQNCRYII